MENTKAIAVKQPWTKEQMALITRTVAKGATQDELGLFFNIAKRSGLDVFTKQIHFVKRKVWNKDTQQSEEVGTIQTGIDGYRSIAERSGTLAGIDDVLYDTETDEHPNKASVTVYRLIGGTRVAFTASARWTEYAAIHPKSKEVMGQWKKMPYLMLGKCAEALALRKAFPNDLSGLYTQEEMDQAQEPIVDATPPTVAAKKVKAEKLMERQPVTESMTEETPITAEEVAELDAEAAQQS
jgi:phage recombination protein Bet